MTLQQVCSLLGSLVFFSTTPLRASETVTYQYDPLGRLVQGNSSGSVNNGLNIQYTIDEAGNRKRIVVTGSSNQGIPTEGVIVVPLNGFTIIPIGQ
jgi:hypothetical protein